MIRDKFRHMTDSLNEKLPDKKNLKITIALTLLIFIIAATLLLSAANPANPKGSIVFNEVVSGNSQPAGGAGSPDWIELYNTSNEDIDLTGYKLTDSNKSAGTELNNAIIKKGGYLVVYAAKNYTTKDEAVCFVNFGISSAGETLYLLSPGSAVAAELEIPALYTDISYARKEDGTYGFCTETTPGNQNSEKIMNEDELKTLIGNGTLALSEVLPRVSGGSAWAEVYNPGGSDIYLGNYCLTDTESDKTKWHFPGQMLKPGEYAAVNLSGTGVSDAGMNASFKLGGADTSIYLFDVTGNCLGKLSWDRDVSGGISVLGENLYTAYPTKGEKNSEDTFSSAAVSSMDNSDPVRINEVLPENEYSICDADGDRCEWAEVYNSSDSSISLKGYFLSDDENDLFKWAFPDIVIEPNSYKIVFLSGKQGKEGELHASFRLSGGEPIYLTNINGLRVDCLQLPETIGENISAGRDESGNPLFYAYPTPGGKNAEGLEDPSMAWSFDVNGLYISEVCAVNEPLSNENDWIELYNGSDNDIDLTGYSLSGNDGVEWSIPAGTIEAKGHYVIEASSGAGLGTGIAGFGISPSGETIALHDPSGRMIDVFKSGVLRAGITSGRTAGNEKRVFFSAATKGATNSAEHLSGYVQRPYLSETGLYKSESFQLSISCDTSGAKIYYTIDGSMPTEESEMYTGPITISENTAVRAAAYSDKLLPSEIKTATYLFDRPHTLPVFCITGKPSEMNYLMNTNRRSKKPEYTAYVEYYEKDGTLGVSFPSGLRLKGRQSIELPQNSLTIRLRSDYGQKNVTYPFFPDSSITTYSALTIRNSGQDSGVAHIRDSYFHRVAKGLDLDTIDTKLAVVYINGKYYGLSDLEEEQTSDYIASHYGLDPNGIDIIDRNGTVIAGGNAEFKRVLEMARTLDTSNDENFAELSKYVDVDACTDYLIARIYFGDGDIINQRFWRAQDYSVKWRPLLFDLDWSFRFNRADRYVFSRYFTTVAKAGNGSLTYMYIFNALKKNKGWRDRFVERFVELAETQFSTQRMLSIFDDTVNSMKPEMELHIKRFHYPGSMGYWNNQITKLRDAIEKRHDIILKLLQRKFNVSDETIKNYIEEYSKKS